MNEFELMMARLELENDAARVRGLLLEDGGSAKADAYIVDARFGERLAAFKAAGGVL